MLVTNIGQLVTIAGGGPRRGAAMDEIEIISNAAMLVRDGLIVAAGPASEFPTDETDIVDAGGRTVLPGFVDAHTHPVWGGNRIDEFEQRASGATYEQIAANGGGIQSSVRQTRSASDDELGKNFARHCQWFCRNGTTTIEAKSGYGLDLETELRLLCSLKGTHQLRVVPTVLAAHAIPLDKSKEHYIADICEAILPEVAAKKLAVYADIFVEQGYFTADDARLIMGRAKELGFKLKMHVDQLSAGAGAELAVELGAATADHLEQTSEAGIQALAASSTFPVLLPASVYALGKTRYPDARRMIDSGLPVVLATDFNPGSSPIPSIPMIMSLACTQMHMSPAEALTAVTVNAACSLDYFDRIGSLEPSKYADFTIWDTSDFREIVYFCGANLLWRTYVGGIQVS
ncbi:MAG: imidazolonepropionase [Fimbriimonadaceae bacterium]